MKSEKAREFIDDNVILQDHVPYQSIHPQIGYRAVELAEQEAGERMRDKALQIIKDMMTAIFMGDMPQKLADESDYAFAASGTDCNPINWGDAAAFVLEGYKYCFAELTRWNDPEEVMPPRNRNVLVKYAMDASHKDYITIGCYNGHAWDLEVGNFAYVVAWREIHD